MCRVQSSKVSWAVFLIIPVLPSIQCFNQADSQGKSLWHFLLDGRDHITSIAPCHNLQGTAATATQPDRAYPNTLYLGHLKVTFKTTRTLLSRISWSAMHSKRSNKYQQAAALRFPSPAPDACWPVLLALWPGTPLLQRQALENAPPALSPNAWHNFARALRGSNCIRRTGLHCICHGVCWRMLIQWFCGWNLFGRYCWQHICMCMWYICI